MLVDPGDIYPPRVPVDLRTLINGLEPIVGQEMKREFRFIPARVKVICLLSNTAYGARARAMLQSIIESVKANGLQP